MISKDCIPHIIIAVLVIITLIYAGYRMSHPKRVPQDVYSGSRGERLETWNDMRRLKLTDENIVKFVDATLSNFTLQPPKGTTDIDKFNFAE